MKPGPKSKPNTILPVGNGGIVHVAGLPTRIWCSAGMTINTGNYESVRVDAGISMDVPDNVQPEKLIEQLWNFVEQEVRTQALDIRSNVSTANKPPDYR